MGDAGVPTYCVTSVGESLWSTNKEFGKHQPWLKQAIPCIDIERKPKKQEKKKKKKYNSRNKSKSQFEEASFPYGRN